MLIIENIVSFILGVPKPKVIWWRGSELVDSTYTETINGTIQNVLSMTNLHRRDNFSKYTCVGVNNNLTFPMTSTITIDLNLKPIDVKITSSQSPLYAWKKVHIVCESWGGRPKTILSWMLGNEILATQELNSSLTRSVLTFLPMAEYDGKTLQCEAVNPLFPHAVLKYHWKLVVLYIPKLTVRFGLGIQPDQIREKSDVYLDCLVDANPPIDSIQWYFQGEEVNTITSFGIFQSNHSLVLRNVTKQWAGGYACGATNVIGTSRSQEIRLLVKYTPTCNIIPNPIIVELGTPVTIICEADAYPSAVTYKWSFSHHNEEMSSSMSSFFNVSEANASFIANVRHIGGLISCWAANSIGEQMDPCTAEISLAGPPDPVESCIVTNANQTEMPAHVICQFGKPKGLNERFHLEVFDRATDILIANISNSKPEFFIQDMNSTTPYTMLLYASNNKGNSEIVSIVANSLPVSREIFSSPVKDYTSLIQEPLFLAPLGVIILLILVCVFIFVKRKRRRKRQLAKRVQKASEETVREEIEMEVVSEKDDVDGQHNKSNPDLIQNMPTELTKFCQKTTETSVEYKIEYTYTLTKGSTAMSS